jgi:hypothetical protein
VQVRAGESFFDAARFFDAANPAAPAVKGQHLYPAVRMFFWQVEKTVQLNLYARF